MMPPAPPDDDAERIRLLHELRILDTDAEPAYDAIARLAASQTGCAIAAVSLVDSERQWFKSAVAARPVLREWQVIPERLAAGTLTEVELVDGVWR